LAKNNTMLEVVPNPAPARRSRARRILFWSLTIFAFLLAALSIAFVIVAKRFEPYARQWLVSAIEKRYEGGVEIGAFHAKFYPLPQASVEDVVVRFHRRTDIPPLAKIKRMTLSAGLWSVFEKPVRIHKVTIENLEISIPPKEERKGGSPAQAGSGARANFVLGEVNADGMILHIIPGDPAKEPRDFEFERLTLHSAALDRPMTYRAKLTNWKPPGDIQANGHFGPWDAPEPGGTPLDGKYIFRDADLSVFKGIAGTLSSDGEFHGQLNRIECNGTTNTPKFSVSVGIPVDLKAQFHAIIDGMNGDTMLDPVKAQFLHSTVIARGLVAGVSPRKGK
jgi:hypothetical protein